MSEVNDKPEDMFGFMLWLSNFLGGFNSLESPGNRATEQEICRWILSGVVEVNCKKIRNLNYRLKFPLKSLVIFPESQRRKVTLV